MTKETIKTFQYRITQATASQLVVILYDMAIEYLNDACESDSAKQAHNNIYMAQKVIDHHMKRSLISASVSLDNNEINRITGRLKKLRASFYEVSKQDDSEPLMKNTQAVYSGLTYSRGGISNETQTDNIENRGFRV